jgi:acetyl esterase
MTSLFSAGRASGVKTKDYSIRFEEKELSYREYNSKDKSACEIIYLHGGGFLVGGLDSHDDICSEICSFTGCRVYSLNYSLAPENKYPSFFSDAIRFYYYKKKLDKPIILIGDSSGASLAGFITQKAKDTSMKPEAQILIYPSLGGSNKSKSYIKYKDAPMLTVDEIEFYRQQATIPMDGGLANLVDQKDKKNMPQTLLVSAEIDPLASDCDIYFTKLQKDGCDVRLIEGKGLPHGFLRARTFSKKANDVYKSMIEYLVAAVKKHQ